MPNVDDELTRRFRAVERTVVIEGLFEGIERQHARKQAIRRVQAGLLAFAVIAVTGAGFLALRAAFTRAPLGPAIGPNVASPNGRIVFSRIGEDGLSHLFVARPDGTDVQQLTHGATDDTDPAVSPDGRWITVVRIGSDGSEQVETISFDRPDGPAREPQFSSISPEPAWAADGSAIAVREGNSQEPSGTGLLVVPFDGDSHVAHLAGAGADLAHPSWSPGSQIVFAIIGAVDQRGTGWDLATVSSDGTGFRLVQEPGDQTAPAWSPDGSRIAFLQPGARGHEIWTIAPDGTGKTLIATAVEASFDQDLAWTPDGSAVLVSDGEWIYHVDATPEVDPAENFVQLVRGVSPSSQPIPAGTIQTSPEPQPSPAADAGPDGYGFGLDICPQHVTWVTEQLDGLGGKDMAFVVIERGADGACPPASPEGYLGVDVDDDRSVDVTYGPIRCEIDCLAFAAPDLDGDGRHEILVTESPGSVFRIGVYAMGPTGTPPSDASGIVRVEIGEPDLPDAGFVMGEPARLSIGGDEGWSYRLRCVDRPEGRFLIASSAFHEVDSGGPIRIDEATLVYGELRLIVVDSEDRTEPLSPDPLGPQAEELCGTPIPIA